MTLGYTCVGEGAEKVLVFEGWFGDYTIWQPTFAAMDTAAFSYIFMDYRGYGKSGQLKGAYTLREIASDANELVLHLGLDSVHVMGHSMGGMAMQRFMLDRDPNIRIKSAIGVTPVSAAGGQLEGKIWDLFADAVSSDDYRYAIIDFTTGKRLNPAWIRHIVASSRLTTHEEAFAGYLQAWGKDNFHADIAPIHDIPVLVLVGEYDSAISLDAMQASYAQDFSHCQLAQINNAGHYPMQETPIWLMSQIEQFLRQHSDFLPPQG